jgi:hypothetical protein
LFVKQNLDYFSKCDKIANMERHWDGTKNKIVRYYFYSQRGLALFNEFRYLFMLLFGIYVLLKLQNPIWLLVMFLTALPLLIGFGWLQVHHMAKIINWLDVEFASYWSRYSFELQERQVKAIEEINHKTPCQTTSASPQ